MEKKKEIALFAFSIIGCIANVFAIFVAIQSWNVSVLIFLVTYIVFIAVIIYLYISFKERCKFIAFIQYLFDNPRHNFNLLPKICLALDISKEANNFYAREMNVKYTYDMRNIEFLSIKEDTPIEYIDTIEYFLETHNKNIPPEFVLYTGNMYAKNGYIKLSQKHGIQVEYESIQSPRYTDETRSDSIVQRYSWQLKKENITKGPYFPISFKLECLEKTKANSNDTIIFYPKQYAEHIEKISFDITFLCDKKVLDKVELFKIMRDGNVFKHVPVSSISILNNKAVTTIFPDSTEYEAYYFRVYWALV